MKKHNFLAVYYLQNTKTLNALPLEGCITALVSNQVTVYGQNAANKITGIQKYDNSVWGLYYLLKLQSQTVFEACVYSGVAHTKNKKQYCGHYFLRVHSKAEPNWTNTPWMLTQICDPDDTDWTVPVMCNKSHPRVGFLGGFSEFTAQMCLVIYCPVHITHIHHWNRWIEWTDLKNEMASWS